MISAHLIRFLRLVRLSFLEQRIPAGMCNTRADDWQPLVSYRTSLLHGETDQLPQPAKRAYTRKRKEGIYFYFFRN